MKLGVEYAIIGLLTLYAIKKKFIDVKKSEYDTLARALEVFREYNDRLTDRINALTEEIEQLKVENKYLQKTISQLQSIIKKANDEN
jgi:predicted nuclease with TOPRIM domain